MWGSSDLFVSGMMHGTAPLLHLEFDGQTDTDAPFASLLNVQGSSQYISDI